jgi:hypothetical protein
MENNKSILQVTDFDSSGQNQLNNSGKWAKFIGIVYLFIATLLLLIAILVLANLDLIAAYIMDINGMSIEALEFMMGAGKWLFTLMMAFSCFILFLNGFFLVKFGGATKSYATTYTEDALTGSFHHLGRYLMLTTILSIVSTVFSVAAIVYYMIK